MIESNVANVARYMGLEQITGEDNVSRWLDKSNILETK